MSPAEVTEALGGLLLVAVVLSDVFRSVVLPRPSPRTLRFGPWIGIAAMRGALRWTCRWPVTQRHDLLGALAPLLIVIEMLIWVVALIVGYGLLLDGLRGNLKAVGTFGDAIYVAASALLTLGLPAEFEANGTARMVVAACALSGLAVVTLTVTFLLAIQGALTEREKLVLRLRARTGPHPSGLALLLAHARLGEEHDPALVELFREWEEWSAAVLLTHRAFPILCYFRSTDADCEWLAALGAALDAAALLVALGAESTTEHATLCHRMGARLAADLARQFTLRPSWSPELDEPAFPRRRRPAEPHRLRNDGRSRGVLAAVQHPARRVRAAARGAMRPLRRGWGRLGGLMPTLRLAGARQGRRPPSGLGATPPAPHPATPGTRRRAARHPARSAVGKP